MCAYVYARAFACVYARAFVCVCARICACMRVCVCKIVWWYVFSGLLYAVQICRPIQAEKT